LSGLGNGVWHGQKDHVVVIAYVYPVAQRIQDSMVASRIEAAGIESTIDSEILWATEYIMWVFKN
jgi:hypothetical protein